MHKPFLTLLLFCSLSAVVQAEGPAPKSRQDIATIAFTTDFYSQFASNVKCDENIAFSPLSITQAIAMAPGGAKGETRKEIEKVLRTDLRSLKEYLSQTTKNLKRWSVNGGAEKSVQLTIANKLWLEKTENLRPTYVAMTKRIFLSPAEALDFKGDPKKACETINAWVAEKTQQKINNLLAPTEVTKKTSLVLANAIYFKASWRDPFFDKYTKKATFLTTSGQKKEVELMHQTSPSQFAPSPMSYSTR